MFEVRNKHGIMCKENGKDCRFAGLAAAKDTANRFCDESDRKLHYTVVEVKDVYVTSTLDEAIKA